MYNKQITSQRLQNKSKGVNVVKYPLEEIIGFE